MKIAKWRMLSAIILAVAALLALNASPVMAQMPVTSPFSGDVTIDAAAAHDGSEVAAYVGDETEARATVTTTDGNYEIVLFGTAEDVGEAVSFKVKKEGTEVWLSATTEPENTTFANYDPQVVNLSATTPSGPTQDPVAPVTSPFSGDVTIDATTAHNGSGVAAYVGDETEARATVTTTDGNYEIVLFGTAEDVGEAVSFKVKKEGTEVWLSATTEPENTTFANYDPQVVNLSATTPAPPDGGVPAPTYYIETTLFGTEESFRISSSGKILETIEATSADGNLTITIPMDTIALDVEGEPLDTLEAAVDESPPDPPEDAHVIGLAYDFGPDGATFDPAITLEYTYDPDALPEGVDEEDLVLAYYDEEASEWVELDGVVDTENNIITASVAHFTTFAIIGSVTPPPVPPAPARFTVRSLEISPSELAPSEEVNISVLVANTGGKSGSYTVVLKIDGVKEAEERVSVAAGGSKTVSFSVTKEEADSYTVAVNGLSGSFTVVPPEPAAFSVAYLSVSPRLEVEPGETVAITVLVANTGGESGSYTVVLKIDGVKEAEETVTIAAGESQDVSFSVTREEADSYAVTVDGLSGSFTVVAPPEEEEVPTKPGINWPLLIGGIIGGVIVVLLGVYFWMRRRAT